MTHNEDHNDTGCCACFRWLFTRHRRRRAREVDGALPEASLPIAEDTLGKGPHSPYPHPEVELFAPPTEVELPESQAQVEPADEVELPESQAQVELPESQAQVESADEVELPESQAQVEPADEVELPESQDEVELPESQAQVEPVDEVELPESQAQVEPADEVELPESQAQVEPADEVKLPEPDVEVKLPEPDVEVKLPEPDVEVKLPEPQAKVDSTKPRPEADTTRKCVRFHFDNLPGFVKDRELYGGLEYFKYGVPLSVIRTQPLRVMLLKQRPSRPQEGPLKAPQSVHNTTQYTGPVKGRDQHRVYNGHKSSWVNNSYYRGRYNGQGYYDGPHGGQGHNYRAHYSQRRSHGQNTQ